MGEKAYHVTTTKKLERYKQTGLILPPVRFWPNIYFAEKWAKKTGRDKIVVFETSHSYPLPDHRPARFTDEHIRDYEVITAGEHL